MARILTGIQSTGNPHLGNLLGAIIPAINLSKKEENESLFFIADLHSFTTIRDAELLRNNTFATAAAWIAFGFDTDKNLFYRQSDVTEVTELTWYLNCFAPFQRLQLAHSFKDKQDRLSCVNNGLFSYPVLMASDILLFQADLVPVGADQKQHLELSRDLAARFNHKYSDTFKIPEGYFPEFGARVMSLQDPEKKMSKSDQNLNNIISLLDSENLIKKKINRSVTDSGNNIQLSNDKPGISNLINIYASLTEKKIKEIRRNIRCTKKYEDKSCSLSTQLVRNHQEFFSNYFLAIGSKIII